MIFPEKYFKAQTILWDGICTVFSKKISEINPETGKTVLREDIIWEDLPCRVSYKTSPELQDEHGFSPLVQEIKLFLENKYKIQPGSRISVTQNGETREYAASGVGKFYQFHQEIELELWKGAA